MKTRDEFLKEIIKTVPPGHFVECGVRSGATAKHLVGERKLWLFDSYEGFPEPGAEDIFPEKLNIRKGFHKFTIQQVKRNLPSIKNVEFVKGWFEETAPKYKDIIKKIAILHFDGDMYSGAKVVLENFLPNVVRGGWVIVHDYPAFPGIKKAVEEIIDKEKIQLLDHCAIFQKKE